MRLGHIHESINRGASWLRGEPEDVIRRLRFIKGSIVGVAALAAVVAFILMRPSAGAAFTPFLGDFNTEYGTGGSRIDSCLVCHVNADPNQNGARNSYGQAWAAAGKSFAAIEGADSDGDGATNIQEINARTFPGNAGDTPPTTTTSTSSTTTTTTTSTTTIPPIVFCQGVQATIVGTDGPDVIRGTRGKDVIAGRGGADTIYGFAGDDILCGGDGWDTIHPGRGSDHVDGGSGARDVVDYSTAKRGVTVSLQTGIGSGQGTDEIEDVESIVGSRYGDVLIGNSRSNRIIGGGGPDSLYGKRGRDFLWGNRGRDTLIGGPGFDEARGGSGVDTCVAEVKVSC